MARRRWKKGEREFVALSRVTRVATVSRGSLPHNVPVCHVVDGDRIYFASSAGVPKVRNVADSGHVTLVCDEYSEDWGPLRGVMVAGTGRVINGGPRFRRARGLLYAKYPQYEREAALEEGDAVVVEVTPRHLFSWGL
jgi:nitroimidazol reductase NimA-like FMN-containing flavoprotein (pyridoxamine 5'-phosphate oxidase superfamily)